MSKPSLREAIREQISAYGSDCSFRTLLGEEFSKETNQATDQILATVIKELEGRIKILEVASRYDEVNFVEEIKSLLKEMGS